METILAVIAIVLLVLKALNAVQVKFVDIGWLGLALGFALVLF